MSESVCPRCRAFHSTAYCPSCGAATQSANSCSQCANSYMEGKFCGECGAPSWRTVIQGGVPPKTGSQPEIRKQGSRPTDVKVDTSSILSQGITPSAVHKGVKAGDDTLSKYRITATESSNENIDWKKTIKNASRAAVDEPDEVMAQRSPEPTVHIYNQTQQQSQNKPVNIGPLPSEQLRRDPVQPLSSPSSSSPITRPPQQVTSPKTGNLPPPPGPSRTVYNPPQPSNPKRGITVVAESTIRPSLLKDSGDPFEKYRISEPPADPAAKQDTLHTSGSKPDLSDPLDKYRVKTSEEEEMTWQFFLTGIAADPGKPVELKCDGQVVYISEGANGMVNTRTSYLASGVSTAVVLTIKSIPFTVNKTLEIANGRFVRFAIEKGGLKFRQQRTELD